MKISTVLIFIFIMSFSELSGQDCKKFHLYGLCMQYPGPKFKIDGQSRSNEIGFGDKFTYSLILYGARQYKFFFCATDKFLPVKYIFKDSLTGDIIYDNEEEDFSETVDITVENTRNISCEVSVLAKNADKQLIMNFNGCIGMLLYYRPLQNK